MTKNLKSGMTSTGFTEEHPSRTATCHLNGYRHPLYLQPEHTSHAHIHHWHLSWTRHFIFIYNFTTY